MLAQAADITPVWLPALLFFGGIISAHLVCHFIAQGIIAFSKRKNLHWLATLVGSMRRPVIFFLWISGLILMTTYYAHNIISAEYIGLVTKILQVGLVAAITWSLFVFVSEVERNFFQWKGWEKTTADMIIKISHILIIIIALMLVLPIFGVEMTGLLAVGGFSGIVLGIAAKEILSNFLGGLIMAIDQPFRIGDWILTADKKVEGIVEHIGWRYVRIRTFEKRALFMPNGEFFTIAFVNATRMTHRQVLKTVEVQYKDIHKAHAMIEDIKAYFSEHPDIDQSQLNWVNITDLTPSSVEITLRAYTKVLQKVPFQKLQDEILYQIYCIAEKHGVKMAFPATQVHFEDVTLFSK